VFVVSCGGVAPDNGRVVQGDSIALPASGNTAPPLSTDRSSQESEPIAHEVAPAAIGVSLDHVPIAVADLDRAAQIWHEKLGVSTKPGRPHANSIENTHLKFSDGTGLELITATQAVDPLAAHYLHRIALGDGAAFIALRPDSVERIAVGIEGAGISFTRNENAYSAVIDFPDDGPLGYLFMVSLFAPPVDLPRHTTHENGASTLHAAWIRKADFEAEHRLLPALHDRTDPRTVKLPDGRTARDVSLDRGHLYLIVADAAERTVVGVTVAVPSAAVVARRLSDAGVSALTGTDWRGRYVRVRPADATGVWLEFLEVVDTDESGHR
jgi:hypothetical protein